MTNDYLTNLLKDLGANNTPSQSINLTSGKDNGQIDVTRKDTLTASAPGQEKVTMYHPSGSTIQVYPYEVSLFENNGYSTQPPQPQQPVQQPVTPVQQPVQQPVTPVQQPATPVTPVQQPVQQPVDQGVGMPNQQTTPQTYTVEMDSPEDLELQDDPNYDEVVNDDGTVTYTSNIDTGTVTPQVPTGVGTYASDVVTPTPVVAPVVAPGVNPRTNREPGMVPVEDQAIPGVNPIGNTDPGVADPVLLPNTDAGGGNLNQNPLGGQSGIDAADARETELIGTPWAPTGDFEEADEDGTYASDNPVGIHGNKKFIQDESGEWISNPAYTPQEMIASDDPLETADAIEEAAIYEFESDSNINNTEDAITNFTTIADLTEDGEGVDAAVQTDDAFTEIELDTSTTPEEKKTLAGGLLDGLKGLFKDGELAKAAMLYFGSRIAGFSHSGSAKFAYGSTDLFGDKGANADYNSYASSVDTALANGVFGDPTSQEAIDRANSMKQQFLTSQGSNSSGASGISKNAKVMITSDGRKAVFDASLGGYRYTDGDREPVTNDVQTYEPNSAAGVRQINKPRRGQIQQNQVAIDNIDFVSTLPLPESGFWNEGQIGSLFSKMRAIYGGENESDTYANFQAGVLNNISLAGRPPGPLSEKEWDYLRAGVPNPRSNPEEYKKYMKAYGTFLKEQNAKLRFMNDYMYKNTGASELDAMNAWHNTASGNTQYSSIPGSGGTSTTDGTTHWQDNA